MAHREGIREFLGKIKLDGRHVVDWGCGTKPIKNYIRGADCYFGIDILDHVGADMVKDISKPVLLSEKFDVAFCLEVAEHVDNPTVLFQNIARNLEDGGWLFFSVPFLYPVHSEHDLWRFTDQGLRLLLEKTGFDSIMIMPTTRDNAGWVGHARKMAQDGQ